MNADEAWILGLPGFREAGRGPVRLIGNDQAELRKAVLLLCLMDNVDADPWSADREARWCP